jgi:regulator of sirC expression with transglutaminase-like and TPR domain
MKWQDLVNLSDADLTRLDIVEVNLACAAGLPGAESTDPAASKHFIDEAARRVEAETARYWPAFERSPAQYANSSAYFRMLALVTVLQRDLGVHYNPDLMHCADATFFQDARNLFVHGVTTHQTGTCNSLPVLYVAVGRRLGYPLKLVSAKQHLFCRWDEPGGKRFNIECTSLGLVTYPDEHFFSWPLPTTQKEIAESCLLRSKAPREELALFLANRGSCFEHNHEYKDSAEAFAQAAELVPDNCLYSHTLCHVMHRWRERLREIWPEGFPPLHLYPPPPRFKYIPRHVEVMILHLKVMDNLLTKPCFDRSWWAPLRAGHRPADLPTRIIVTYNDKDCVQVAFEGSPPAFFTGTAQPKRR